MDDKKMPVVSAAEVIAEDGGKSSDELEAFIIQEEALQPSIGTSRLICLTYGLGGLQVVWSVILSNGSPYLVSLGLSKSLTALVWIAAPLCGTIVQPLVGSWSDKSSSRWGRRRSFILTGAIGLVISMLFLAWAGELILPLVPSGHHETALGSSSIPVILFATFWIYALNIAIQPVQAGIRSLIVENCPLHQQAQANTYASVMTGLGNIVGYLFGFGILPYLGNNYFTPFQMLCLFASLMLSLTVGITCITISEEPVLPSEKTASSSFIIRPILCSLLQTYRQMPNNIRKVCHVQFLSWMGWFPFLYYSTTYVGEFYAGKLLSSEDAEIDPHEASNALFTPGNQSQNAHEAIRYGTFASFLFALVTFAYNLCLPLVVEPAGGFSHKSRQEATQSKIVQAWKHSQALFAILMFLTFFVSSLAGATAIIAFAGLSWALTLFAPFAIISTELAAQRAKQSDDSSSYPNDGGAPRPFPEPMSGNTGAIMGLHNAAISLPQIIAALACSAIYSVAKAFNVTDGTGWVLRAGGIASLGAAWLCRRLE